MRAIGANAPQRIDVSGKQVARSGGFEPPTPRFVVWCSIQLSYERAEGAAPGAGHVADPIQIA